MPEIELKSSAFRREREATWRSLDALVEKVEKQGISSLSPDELLVLPSAYRATVSSLSVAREISLDRSLLNYLESLSTRAFFCVYGSHGGFFGTLAHFLTSDFPSAVRQAKWHILVAAAMLTIGAATGYSLTISNLEWFYTFVSDAYANGRTPGHSTEELLAPLIDTDYGDGALQAFASFLFSHNASIGILCFALGFAYGIPVFILLFGNGTLLGSFVALYVSRGLGVEFGGWLFIHGTTEILAIILAAGSGLVIGHAAAFPGQMRRRDRIVRQGRPASIIAMGAIVMFLIASLLEGFGRQLIQDTAIRYLVGGVALSLWVLYFTVIGRGLKR